MRPGRTAGVLCLAAALVHGGLTSSHFDEWWAYGVFFLVVTTAQAILGLALLLDAFESPRQVRRLRLSGIAGNAAVVATYVVSRTTGIPFLGPSPGAVEPVDLLGLFTLAAELAVIALLALAMRGDPRHATRESVTPARADPRR